MDKKEALKAERDFAARLVKNAENEVVRLTARLAALEAALEKENDDSSS